MNIKTLLKERGIKLRFIENLNEEIKEEIRRGEIITNKSKFTESLVSSLGMKNFWRIETPSLKIVSFIEKKIKKKIIVGIGGGRAIDVAKKVASDLNLPLISIPTAPSHDGLISKNASLYIKNYERVSFKATYPKKIFIPLKLWRKSGNLKKAGFCDILSNIIALQDISLAEKIKKEKFKIKYKILSEKAIKYNTISNLRFLAFALFYSGLAMEETSRYCSGSEHDVERLLEKKMKNKYLHGQLTGTGILISAKIYSTYWKILPKKLKFSSKDLFRRVSLKMKKKKVFKFALLPLREREFQFKWLKNLSKVRPQRFNLWNIIDSNKINWKKIISQIIKD